MSGTSHAPTPRWVWAIVLLLAASQPLLLLWIRSMPPEGMAPTGLHIPDSALFLYSMDMFTSGFHSDYAFCTSPNGDASLSYYAVPHLWLYGALGVLHKMIPIPAFLLYGLASGLGMGLYLYAIYRFLRVTLPQYANTAFLLFALSSGPGGLLYIVAVAAGLDTHPNFELYFDRFALYTLCEGPHLNPVLYAPRFYYTISLAALFGAMTLMLGERRPSPGRVTVVAVLCVTGSFLNARFGVFTTGILILALLAQPERPARKRLGTFLAFATPTAIGCAFSALLMRLNPATVANHMQAGAMAMWFSPFIAAALFHLIIAVPSWKAAALDSGGWAVRVQRALLGYLALYALGCLAHQGYYGTLLTGRDATVAATISDWALPGLLAGLWRGHRFTARPDNHAFFLIWFLLFLAVSMSGWGQGWFLRFGPQRLEPLLWLPLCALCALALHACAPGLRTRLTVGLVAISLPSLLIALLVFQGPLGASGNEAPYGGQQPEFMTMHDAELIANLPEGRVLAPAPAADAIALQRRQPVVQGIGSFNLTDLPVAELSADAARFFAPDTLGEVRKSICRKYCVDWVYCPDTWPVDAGVLESFRGHAWMESVAQAGGGVVFRVNLEAAF